MIALFKSLWAKAVDANRATATRIGAILALIGLLAAPIVVLVMLVQFFHAAYSAMGAVFLLVCLWVAERFLNVIQRNQQAAEQEKIVQQQMVDVISRRIAVAIIPAISQVTAWELEPEDIMYDLGTAPHGEGFYYATPRLLDEQEVMQLRRLIITKLYGRVQITRTNMGREGIVIVGKDHVFIRNDPRIIQHFTTNG